MNEIWKPIYNFYEYSISNIGRIKRNKKSSGTHVGKILKLKKDKDGYLEIGLWKYKKKYYKRIHRLVLENFNPVENMNKLECNHRNGIKDDNRLSMQS